MKKITLITQNLKSGGVQKSVTSLAHTLAEVYRVHILTFEESEPFFELAEKITVSSIDYFTIDPFLDGAGEYLFERRTELLRKFFTSDDSDLYIAFEDYNSLLALSAGAENIIVSPRVSRQLYRGKNIHLLGWEFYEEQIKRLYPKAKAVAAVSEGVAAELPVRAVCVPNGIDCEAVSRRACEPCMHSDFILHTGRIDFMQKGQDDTLKAFRMIADGTDKKLCFAGDGPDSLRLETMIRAYELEERVQMMKTVANPYALMRNCDLFVFSSYFEGMPNTLLEALCCGADVVTYEFQPSWKEVCGGGELCTVPPGDIDGLAEKMLAMLSDERLRNSYSANTAGILRKFSVDKFRSGWLELVSDCLK